MLTISKTLKKAKDLFWSIRCRTRK